MKVNGLDFVVAMQTISSRMLKFSESCYLMSFFTFTIMLRP